MDLVFFYYMALVIFLGNTNEVLDIIVNVLIIAFGMKIIEFIASLIFIRCFEIRLWDYRNRKGNIMGIICPMFSLIWLAVGSLYYFLLNPILVQGITWISDNLIYTYFVGAVIGAICVDFAYSIHLASKLSDYKE